MSFKEFLTFGLQPAELVSYSQANAPGQGIKPNLLHVLQLFEPWNLLAVVFLQVALVGWLWAGAESGLVPGTAEPCLAMVPTVTQVSTLEHLTNELFCVVLCH